MGKEQSQQYYDSMYKTSREYSQDPRNSVYYKLWFTVIKCINKREVIIDLGCGPGQFAQTAVRRGLKYGVGVDFSKQSIKMAKKRNPQLRFEVEDLKNIKHIIPKYPGDVYVAVEVLEHIQNDIEVIEEIPSGKHIVLTTPTFDSKGHVRMFSSKQDVIERYGELISIIEMISVTNLFFVLNGIRVSK